MEENTAAPTFSRIVGKISPILNKNNYLKIIKMKLSKILNKCRKQIISVENFVDFDVIDLTADSRT